ncbi:MAG: endonuclease domain-containing protein [Candidatus Edwardsbacteria bacterium]|nr:endonuclease domain-containing protein [Candidatus Edwardsbacteria bacterium]
MRFEKYDPKLKELARTLRNNSTKAEIRLWRYLRNKQVMGLDFHRQKPIGNCIANFHCPKIKLVIEVDGYTHKFQDTVDKDRAKEECFISRGIAVLRIIDDEYSIMRRM